jgi:mannitol-1-/sugar-/sorbitol-6-phosphatase
MTLHKIAITVSKVDSRGGDPLTAFPFKGILFDLDGTLINSIAAVDRAWARWAEAYGLDPEYVTERIHGRRAVDSIAVLAPDVDQEKAFELIETLEATDTEGVYALSGANQFLEALGDIPWGIVTSGSLPIAVPRLKAGGIEPPLVFITAEQVTNGKPHPDPFLEGANQLGIPPKDIIAFEDTLAGVHSAHAAGMKVIALSEEAAQAADGAIPDYRSVRITQEGDILLLNLA